MPKVCFLTIHHGNFEKGFLLTLRIRGESEPSAFVEDIEDPSGTEAVIDGRLSPCPELLRNYQDWQKKFKRLDANFRGIKVNGFHVLDLDQYRKDCEQSHTDLLLSFRDWLKSYPFRSVEDELRTYLQPGDEIQFLIQTNSDELRKMPWDTWEFMCSYPKAAIGITPLRYKRIPQYKVGEKLRILAILGSTKGVLNLTEDRKVLESFPRAEVCFITEPKREDLAKLWEEKWDVLFFAGHSSSQPGERDYIDINKYDRLSIIELQHTLRQAVNKGLKLAIFNSCDGLGLAKRLEDFRIPQVIVWGEPVPDMVAHTFLKAFMQEFSQGNSLYMSVRRSREKLRETSNAEKRFPGVSFLPVIIQNPLVEPLRWPSDTPPDAIPEITSEIFSVEAPERKNWQAWILQLYRPKLLMIGGLAMAAIFLLLIVPFILSNLNKAANQKAELQAQKVSEEAEKKLEQSFTLFSSRSSRAIGQDLHDVQKAWKTYRGNQCQFEASITGDKFKQKADNYSCLSRITKERTKEFNSYVQQQKILGVGKDYKIADNWQKKVYNDLKIKSTAYQLNLENAQNSWMKFRDVACEFEGKFVKNGEKKNCLIRETEQRSKELEKFLK